MRWMMSELIHTPFENINPVDYDPVITELQKRLRKAEEVIKVSKESLMYCGGTGKGKIQKAIQDYEEVCYENCNS